MLAITGSAAQAGLVAAAQTAPFLVWFLSAGALVDRWRTVETSVALSVSAELAPSGYSSGWTARL
ncbi:MAG TPA: hypothetical protein VFI65_08825 [Streptosporangiaceae bacterium]|nr:hypothetical protein [Streptosporangiaceae bacterium]